MGNEDRQEVLGVPPRYRKVPEEVLASQFAIGKLWPRVSSVPCTLSRTVGTCLGTCLGTGNVVHENWSRLWIVPRSSLSLTCSPEWHVSGTANDTHYCQDMRNTGCGETDDPGTVSTLEGWAGISSALKVDGKGGTWKMTVRSTSSFFGRAPRSRQRYCSHVPCTTCTTCTTVPFLGR